MPADAGIAPIREDDFRALVSERSADLFRLAERLVRAPFGERILTRPLVGRLLSAAAMLEELLDAYGAHGNSRWHRFRETIAACRSFAGAAYKILHLSHTTAAYQLRPVAGDFSAATEDALVFTGNALMLITGRLLDQGRPLGLAFPRHAGPPEPDRENLPPGRLPRDRAERHVHSAEATVAHLATTFLNLSVEADLLHAGERGTDTIASLIPEPLNEESLRQLEFKFHNLQSAYDTFVSDTDTERLDADLPVLRGHASVIFHLLEVTVILIHYYERHLMLTGPETAMFHRSVVPVTELHRILRDYCLAFASRYLTSGRSLCQSMLRRYAELGRELLPAPRYHGFHVRPSTLVARIVHHYGSEVQMELDGELYDASAPLDLFRANEKLNALKRRRIAEEIDRRLSAAPPDPERAPSAVAIRLIEALAREGMAVIHETPLPVEDRALAEGETLPAYLCAEVARLLAMRKIDIRLDLQAAFLGDRRVLRDIRTLAEAGYGEDAAGNNLPLPPSLRYLRH